MNDNRLDLKRIRAFTNAAKLIHLFTTKHWITYADITKRLGCCRKTAMRYVHSLQVAGFVIDWEKDGRITYYSLVYFPEYARISPNFTKGNHSCISAQTVTGTD